MATQCHKKLNGKKGTITVIQCNGYTAAAYSDAEWKGGNYGMKGKSSFILSVSNKARLDQKDKEENAIQCNRACGPTFGV